MPHTSNGPHYVHDIMHYLNALPTPAILKEYHFVNEHVRAG
eukprot:SAG22_NODE_20557_length_264_cov_1.509091_1_plen_40_part_10